MKRLAAGLAFLLWLGIITSAYYVVQNPRLLNVFPGFADTLWTLFVAAMLLFNAYGLGTRILYSSGSESIEAVDRLLLGCGIGLGVLGLLGLGFSAAGLANEILLTVFQFVLAAFFIFKNDWGKLRDDLRAHSEEWNLSFSQYSLASRVAILLPFAISFLLTLAPQFEAFDALLYHLAQPARVLLDGGLRAVDIPHFWFPNLTENLYLWTLAMRPFFSAQGGERAAQMMHLAWGTLAALILWRWTVRVWGMEAGRKTLLLLSAIPSLPMLASWAYADMALVFYAVAALYALTNFAETESPFWLRVTGIMAGLAMTVKYTSFTVPVACGLLILFSQRKSLPRAILRAAQFGFISLIVAAPWYVRNAVIMGNPFYPFAFGGRYWDAFRNEWYAGAGTGIGWDAAEILLLPLNVMLGFRDENFFDGRIGPLFLVLTPLALWILLTRTRQESPQSWSLLTIGAFSAVSFLAWSFGVINSSHLWQARLLFPALIPFAIPCALGWDAVTRLDTSRLRTSFLVNALIGIVIALTIFDNAIFLLQRNPLAVAFGFQSREGYIARVQPAYAALMGALDELPTDASLYSLFEPRSYSLPRRVQPDAVNYNFSHDLYLHNTPAAIIEAWKAQGYTHIIVNERGLRLGEDDSSNQFTPARREALRATLAELELVSQTPEGDYSIYQIP